MIDYAYTVELTKAGKARTEPFVPDLLLDTLRGLGSAVEDDERGEAVCPRVDFSAWATPEAADFIASLADPEQVYVNIYEYDARIPTKRYKRFAGVLVELPRRGKSADEDVYIFSATGFLSTYDEVDVVDPVSSGAYRDVHYTDLIPDLLEDAGHHGGYSVTTTPFTAADRWASRLFYPGKHHFGGNYVTTDRITAMCDDGTNIYLGVGHWLCRYNPETRAADKLARLNYTGALALHSYDFRIAALAYSGGNVVGWAEPTTANLKTKNAHVKISFTWAAGNLIALTDANLIYCYDRGYFVKGWDVNAVNEGGPSGTDFAQWRYKEIGDAMPPSDQTFSVPETDPSDDGWLGEAISNPNQTWLRFVEDFDNPPNLGDRVWLNNGSDKRDMGTIVEIINFKPKYHIRCTNTAGQTWALPTAVILFEKGISAPKPNLVLPGYREIKIEYAQVADYGAPTPVSVTVERRRQAEGRTSLFWPEMLGEADERTAPFVPGPYIALCEGNLPEWYKDVGGNKYYIGEAVPNFWVKMEGAARFANMPAVGYYVQNTPQSISIAQSVTGPEECHYEQPGENVLMFNGVSVKIVNEASHELRTRGNIYLATEGAQHYVAWNRWRWAPGNNYFLQTVWGELDGATVKITGKDRVWENYQARPPRELTGFAVLNGRYYFGVKRVEPNWVNTSMRIIWAAPPQNALRPINPTNYSGDVIAVCMVTYDKTEYLSQGDLIRVGDLADPGDKEYLISEVEAIGPREINNTTHSYRTYTAEARTYFTLFALDGFGPGDYSKQAKAELADKYITIQRGWDIRGEICYASGNSLVVGHTATEEYGEPADGERYDWEQQEWHGESVMPEEDGPMPYATLSNENVIPGSLVVTLMDGKKEFTVTDKSTLLRGEMPIPPLGEVYVKYRSGSPYSGDFNETWLYFNPAYLAGHLSITVGDLRTHVAGPVFDVEYEYYTKRLFVEPFVLDGALYFNETESGHIYRRDTDTTWTRAATWPQPVCAVNVLGDDVYALGENDYALMRYGKEWPGYINAEVGGADPIDVFTALAKVAQAADCYLGEEAGRIAFKPREQSAVPLRDYGFEDFETCQYIEQKQYRGVLLTYANGKAYYGQNDPPDDLILERSAPYVADYEHALELARRYYEYFSSGAIIYDVETARDGLQVPALAEIVEVGEVKGRLLKYEISGPKIGMLVEKSVGGRLGLGELA